MAIKKTTIEESPDSTEPEVIRTTKTVVNPDIHTAVVDTQDTVVDSPSSSTVRQTRTINEPLVKTQHPQKIYETKKAIFRSWQIIWYVVAVVEIIIALRVAFKAIGANPFSGFVSLIYGLSDPLTFPFRGIIGSTVTSSNVIEWSSIIAALIYLLIAWGIVSLIHMARPVTPEEVEENV